MNNTNFIREYYSKIQRKIPMNELEYENQKFIQIYIGSKPYLRFGGPSHEQILVETLSNFRIPIIRNSENPQLIKTKTKDYELVGVGRAKKLKDSEGISLRSVNDRSVSDSHNLYCNQEHARKISDLTKLIILVNQ